MALKKDSFCVSLCPEFSELVAGVVRYHGWLAGLPARGADLTVLISVLEGLDHAKDLVDVAANGQIVLAELAESALAIDDVSGTKCDTFVLRVLKEAAIVARDLLGDIGDHGEGHGAETTRLPRLHRVLSVRELRVDGATDELAVDGLEVGGLVTELADLSRAHEREVKRPEEQDNILAYKMH